MAAIILIIHQFKAENSIYSEAFPLEIAISAKIIICKVKAENATVKTGQNAGRPSQAQANAGPQLQCFDS